MHSVSPIDIMKVGASPCRLYTTHKHAGYPAERKRIIHYIAFDSHKRYTWALVESREGRKLKETKLPHGPGAGAFSILCRGDAAGS